MLDAQSVRNTKSCPYSPHVGGDLALALGVDVRVVARDLVAAVGDDPLGLGERMRGNGRVGTSSAMPKSSAISSPCFSFTAVNPATMSSSCIFMTSSWVSTQLISASIEVNSVAWP